eukprot:842296-Pleurochrysis_carterae.AAC.1
MRRACASSVHAIAHSTNARGTRAQALFLGPDASCMRAKRASIAHGAGARGMRARAPFPCPDTSRVCTQRACDRAWRKRTRHAGASAVPLPRC